MLQTLHEKFSGVIAKIVLGIIVIVFGGFFGTQQFMSSRTATYVADVDGHEISQQEFRERWDAFRSQIQRMYGQQMDMTAIDTPERKREVLEQMINEQLILNADEKLGAAVPRAAVQSEIASYPAFQVDGKFSQDQYRQLLAQQRRSPAEFADIVRRELELRQMDSQLSASAFVTDADVNNYVRLRDQTRDFRFLKIEKPSAADVKIADTDIDAYYKAHASEFMTPEKISLDYVELDASKMKVATSVDDETLKKLYEDQKSRFVTSEQRLASHILVKVDKNADADAQKAALAKAEGIAKEAKSGKDFAALAKADSDDLGSKSQGGDLGWLEKGVTDPAFESALFAMKKGDISDPVKSDEGYHIIDLRDVKAEKVKPYAEVKNELSSKYLEGERERQYSDVSGKLTDAVYQDPTSLDAAAKQLDLPVQKTGLFARTGGEGIAANPAVLKAAFSGSVLAEGNASDPIEIGPSHIVVVRVDQHEKSEPKPIDQVRDDIRKTLTNQQIAKAAHERADTLYARFNKGESLDKIADELKSKAQDEKEIGRNAANLDRKLVDSVFKLDRPQDGKTVNGETALADDNYVLIALTAVKDGDASKLDAKTREAARNTLRQSMGALAVRGYVDSLRKNAKVEVAEDRLQ
ncbi:MAG TPA: SurA N-terminal domain-containing protein [Rudaea sp.]|jgi:peptidyl-prolyl cis-trans isomerase D|nr:SurA N-terminal domain-containing protein [Rudaea sp.]